MLECILRSSMLLFFCMVYEHVVLTTLHVLNCINGRFGVQQFYLKADFISVSAGWVGDYGKKI